MRRATFAVFFVLGTFAVARNANAQDPAEPASQPRVSIALERVAGFSYTKLAAKNSDDSAGLTAFALGSVTVNPYVSPRLGIDVILDPGVTLGAGVSVARFSLSGTATTTTTTTGPGGTTNTTTSSSSQDFGSLFLYTLTPRVGYRIQAAPGEFDITPRAGLTLAGGSVSSGDGKNSGGVFALALSAEGVAAWRVTKSFNLLGGVALDYTVSATASSTTTSSSGSSSSSTDIKGSLFAGQLWLGLGGYL
jgi:hypothetical protein